MLFFTDANAATLAHEIAHSLLHWPLLLVPAAVWAADGKKITSRILLCELSYSVDVWGGNPLEGRGKQAYESAERKHNEALNSKDAGALRPPSSVL